MSDDRPVVPAEADNPLTTTWEWLKTAPLPVVLAISMVGFGTMGNWVSSVAAEADRAKVAAEEAKAKAAGAKDVAEKSDHKLDRVSEKLDQLLEEVIRLRTIQEEERRKNR